MRLTQKSAGYTIAETMIALAVSTAMLATTIALTSGQIAKHQFRTDVQNVQQMIQDVLNDVQAGYFTDSTPPSSCGGATTPVGSSDNCVYIGKSILIDLSPSNDPSIIATPIYMTSAYPSAPFNISGYSSLIAESPDPQTRRLPGGVDYEFRPLSLPHPEVFALFANYNDVMANDFVGGALSVGTYVVSGGGSDQLIKQSTSTPRYLCMSSGQRKAKIDIGVAGSPKVNVSYSPTASECP